MEVCRFCGRETTPVLQQTPTMIHHGKLLCEHCGAMLRWAKKENNKNKRTRTSKYSIEINYCQWCLREKINLGKHETLHLHHMIPLCFGGVDEKENLLTLCTSCHSLAHWSQRYLNHDLDDSIIKKLNPNQNEETAMKIYNLKINVSKIRKERLFHGEKGIYCDITVIENDQPDEYGYVLSCFERPTKEEREAKTKRNYLGNAKLVYDDGARPEAQAAAAPNTGTAPEPQESADDIPW